MVTISFPRTAVIIKPGEIILATQRGKKVLSYKLKLHTEILHNDQLDTRLLYFTIRLL